MADTLRIYTDEWRALGIVSVDEIAEDVAALASSDDPHPEHYRWRRFVKFIHNRAAIDSSLATSLYDLGTRDPDPTLGESMISVIIRLDDCPRELHERSLRSSSDHLKQVAASRLGLKNG